MKGTVKLREGLVQLPSLGEELHAVRADITLDPSGTIRLERGSAEGVTGLVQVAASARELVASLVTTAEPRNREIEAQRARERSARRFGVRP